MEDNKKIMLISKITGTVVVDIPDLRYKRTWEKIGAKKPMDWSVLKEAIYDPGFEYMVHQGIIFIDDKEARVELGLEESDQDSPIKILSESQLKRMATVMPLVDFKQEIAELPYEQINLLASYMIKNGFSDLSKTDIIKKAIGTDVIKAIQLKRANEED